MGFEPTDPCESTDFESESLRLFCRSRLLTIRNCTISNFRLSASKGRFAPSRFWRGCFLLFFFDRCQTAFLQFGYQPAKKTWGVQRGISPWLWVSNRGEQYPVGTRFCAAKSNVLYLLRPLTLERGCHRTGQTVSCGSRRTDICKHGRLADIRSSGVGDAA